MPSVFITHPQDQFIYDKEIAVFECAASGSDLLKINWTRNDEQISNSHYKISTRITNIGRTSVLEVMKATADDSGVYRCAAINADHEIISKPAELLSKIAFCDKLCTCDSILFIIQFYHQSIHILIMLQC